MSFVIDFSKYELGQVTKNLIEDEDFNLEYSISTYGSLKDGVKKSVIDFELKNSKGKRIASSQTRNNNIKLCLNNIEKATREEFNRDFDKKRPLRTLVNRINNLTKTHGSSIGHTNAYSVIFDTNKDSPRVLINYYEAGNTILEFCPISQNSILSDKGTININPNNYNDMRFSETIGQVINYVSDYLTTDWETRITEWENRFGIDEVLREELYELFQEPKNN